MAKSLPDVILNMGATLSVALTVWLFGTEIWPTLERVDYNDKQIAIQAAQILAINDKVQTLEHNDREIRKDINRLFMGATTEGSRNLSGFRVVVISSGSRYLYGSSSSRSSNDDFIDICRTCYRSDSLSFVSQNSNLSGDGFHVVLFSSGGDSRGELGRDDPHRPIDYCYAISNLPNYQEGI